MFTEQSLKTFTVYIVKHNYFKIYVYILIYYAQSKLVISRLYTRVNKRDRLNTLEYLRHVLYGSLLNMRNLVSDIVNKK